MTTKDLMKLLEKYPENYEVIIEVNNDTVGYVSGIKKNDIAEEIRLIG